MTRRLSLLGAPIESGSLVPGCRMGPASLRTAGIDSALRALGHHVTDLGDLTIAPTVPRPHANTAIHHLAETCAWVEALQTAALNAARQSDMAIFLGGDHALSAGTVPGLARYAAEEGRPLFVLWLDAHPDLHSLQSTTSGNLHGTPVGYFTGQPGFDDFPPLAVAVDPRHVCMMGIRSVDPHEQALIGEAGITVHDMRFIDENGVYRPLEAFLERVSAANGLLHVSLDVDFLDPAIAPAVGTAVRGGATFREAHLIMEVLHDSGLVTSLDLVELNPFLDERGATALLLRDLAASLLGARVLDRPSLRSA